MVSQTLEIWWFIIAPSDISYHNHNKTPLCFTNGIFWLILISILHFRKDCFSTDTFRQCLQTLLLEKESEFYMEMVQIIGKKKRWYVYLFLTASIVFAVVGIYYRSNPSTRFIINSVHIIYCDDLIQMFVPKCQLRFSEA